MFLGINDLEYLVIGVVALLVFKPQDLPMIMKKAGQFIGAARRMAADFRSSFEDMARQSELDQLRQEVEAMKAKATQITSDHLGGVTQSLTSTVDDINSSLDETPALTTVHTLDAAEAAAPEPVPAPPPEPRVRKAAAKPAARSAPKSPARSAAARPRKSPSQ